MIRFTLAACVILSAALIAPAAAADAVTNSADLVVAASPLLFLCILWPLLYPRRRPRAPWIADISSSHPDALGSLDRERIAAPPNP